MDTADPAEPETSPTSAKLLVAAGALLLVVALGGAWALRGPYQGPATRACPHAQVGVTFTFTGKSPEGEAFTYTDRVEALDERALRLRREGSPDFGFASGLLNFVTNEAGSYARGRKLSELETAPLVERRRGTLSVSGIVFTTLVLGIELPFVGDLEVTLAVDGEELIYPGLLGLTLGDASHLELKAIEKP